MSDAAPNSATTPGHSNENRSDSDTIGLERTKLTVAPCCQTSMARASVSARQGPVRGYQHRRIRDLADWSRRLYGAIACIVHQQGCVGQMGRFSSGLIGICAAAVLFQPAVASNTPCSGRKGGISHCQGSTFICNDGSVSASKRNCSAQGAVPGRSPQA